MRLMQHRQPVMIEADHLTLRWAQNWPYFGIVRRSILTMMDRDRAEAAAMIASGRAVAVAPQRRQRGIGF